MATKEKRRLEKCDELEPEVPPAKKQRTSAKTSKPIAPASESKSDKDDCCEKEDIDICSIIFLTGNQGKLREVKSFFGDKIGKLISNKKLDLEETQGTPKEIIGKKLLAAREVVGENVAILVEDTSLVLNAYTPKKDKNKEKEKSDKKEKSNSNNNNGNENSNGTSEDQESHFLGFPGPFVKWLLKWDKDGNQGLSKMVRGLTDNTGFALCIFGFLPAKSDKPLFFGGKCDGVIADTPLIGKEGFGWDPVFVPKEDKANEKSFSQMTTEDKNKVSHRGKALVKFKQYLETDYLKDFLKEMK